MAQANFQKPGVFKRLVNVTGDAFDRISGGTKLQRDFVGNYNSAVKQKQEAEKIYFRVIEHQDKFNGLTLKMLVFYTDVKVVAIPSLTGNQITAIKNSIKNGKGKGYIKGNKIETFERVTALPDRVTSEWLFNSNRYYNVSEFMER